MRRLRKSHGRNFLLLFVFMAVMGIFVSLNGCVGTDGGAGTTPKRCKSNSECTGYCQLCVLEFCGPCQRRAGWSCNAQSGKCDIILVKPRT